MLFLFLSSSSVWFCAWMPLYQHGLSDECTPTIRCWLWQWHIWNEDRHSRVQGFIKSSLYNTRLYNEIHVVVPSCYTHEKPNRIKNYYYSGVGDEFRSLTAWGKKLLWILVVCQQILLYLLPDGSRVNRLFLGWVLSFSILWVQRRHLTGPKSSSLWTSVSEFSRLFWWCHPDTTSEAAP